MRAKNSGSHAKSHAIQIQWLATLCDSFLDKSLQFGARLGIIEQFLPTLVVELGKLSQLVEYCLPFSIAKLRQFLDDFRCAHGEIIASVGNLSGESLSETSFDEKGEEN